MQKLQLSIPEPCHQNWHHMTPTDQGRFCNACAKEVVDFSMMTDTEVLNYFTTLTHEKVCGRALPSQLDRTIYRPKDPKKRLFWYWNYIVMFLMFFTKANTVKAQGGIKPVTEISPVKANETVVTVAGYAVRRTDKIITGKVTDIDGNPVSFASIKIKGASTGVSADANGAYSMRVNSNAVLFISGATFKSTEVRVGSASTINTVLEKIPGNNISEIVVGGMLGGISFRNVDSDYSAPDKIRGVAIIKVKDEETGKYLPNASVVINSNSFIDTVLTDTKGVYKIKGIEKFDNFYIKVDADGYESNEFTISEADFKDRKKEWEVLLRKQKSSFGITTGTTTQNIKGDVKVRRHCQTSIWPINTDSLYVIDGIIATKAKADSLNPDDISDIIKLEKSEATGLFGIEGANGVIVITTRKAKEKSLKEVVVTSAFGIIRRCRNGASCLNLTNLIKDTIKTIIPGFNDNFKIYPNPVQRGEQFNISLKLKQTGSFQIYVSDAAGRTVLQKQINTTTKEFTEMIHVDNRWSSGLYYISLIDNKNQLVNKKSFIVR